MKKTMCALAVCAIGTLALGNGTASAFTLNNYNGTDAVQFIFSGLTESNDPMFGLGPMTTGETWGIFRVTTIQSADGEANMHWQQNQNNEQIYGIVYGLYDWKITGSGPVDIYQQGGSFELFISSTAGHAGEYNTTLGPAGRFAVNGYNTVTNIVGAQPFLSGSFVPGVVAADNNTTVLQAVTGATSPVTGVGSGYGDLTGGNYLGLFGQDSLNNRDVHIVFDVKLGAKNGWDQVITGTIDTTPVPVPATLVLLGSSLAGLLGLRRKRNA